MVTKLNQLFVLTIFLMVSFANNSWALQMDPSESAIHFMSIKKNAVAEIHRFKKFDFQITESGSFTWDVDLNSVETGIAIRDQRMRDMLFEVIRFPKAKVTGVVPPENYVNMKSGDTKALKLPITLYLHGIKKSININIEIVKKSNGNLVVFGSPFIVNAKDFGLLKGIDELTKIAKLSAISTAVPVFFKLTLIP